MVKDIPDGTSRRKLLSRIGVGTAALAGLPALSAASDEERERATSADSSRRLLDELNNPRILRASRKEVEMGEDLTLTSTIVHTVVGDLIYAEIGDEHKGIQFHLQSRGSRAASSHSIPTRYEGVPEGGKGILLVDTANTMDEVGYLRDVSTEETARLESVVGVDATRIMFNSTVGRHGGYEVHTSVEGRVGHHGDAGPTPIDSDREAYLVPTDERGDLLEADVEHVAEPDAVRAQGECRTWVNACLSSIVTCSGCLMACASVGVGALPMALACIACNMGCHAALPTTCGLAVQNC